MTARSSIGLGDVDNTADINKPVSNDTRAAIDEVDTVSAVKVIASDELIYRKSIKGELPFKFPGYDTAFAAAGSPAVGYIYPQGHCYDAEGRLYIKYANGSSAVIVWYDAVLAFGGWFLIGAGGESLVIIDTSASKKLYSKGSGDTFWAYNISAMPATGAVVAGVNVGITGAGLQYAHANGRWIIEQLQPDVGGDGSRTKWVVYDDAFNRTGEFYVEKNVVGWQLPAHPLYNYIPKTQGVALRGDKVVFGIGGSYIPDNDGPTAPVVAATGIAVCNLDGTLARYGAIDANKLLTKLNDLGYAAIRTESEGVAVRPDGSISHLVLTVGPLTPGADARGIVLFTELDQNGEDWSGLSHPYAPFSMARTFSGTYPRGAGGGMFNPFSGEQFTTMEQILRYMAAVQAPRFSWYTSAVTIAPLAGISLPNASAVEIINQNDEAFLVRVVQMAGAAVTYGVNLALVTAYGTGSQVTSLAVAAVDGVGDVSAKILTKNKSASDADLMFVHQQSTNGGNLLALGGGSSLYYAVSRVWVYIASTLTTKTGAKVAEFFTNGFNPGAHLGFDLGTLLLQWREGFFGKITCSGTVKIGEYTLATMPSASANAGALIVVTDSAGGAKFCRSNGSVWQVLNTTTTVS